MSDLVERLPKMYQDLARAHLAILFNLAVDETRKWVVLMLDGDYEKAHKMLVAEMSTDELIKDMKALKTLIRLFNKRSKAETDMWRTFFLNVILILLTRAEKDIMA